MAYVAEITLAPTRSALLHQLNRDYYLYRDAATFGFRTGPRSGPFVTVNRLAAEALIDHNLVDNHGRVDQLRSNSTLFMINNRGRVWCATHPEPAA